MSRKKVSVTFNEYNVEKNIFAELNEDGAYGISLGFLSYQHIYVANFKISHKLGQNLVFHNGNSNYISVISINYLATESSEESENFVHEIYVNVRVAVEPWLQEMLMFRPAEGDGLLQVMLNCKILTMAMGYPTLKSNVRCVDKFSEDSV